MTDQAQTQATTSGNTAPNVTTTNAGPIQTPGQQPDWTSSLNEDHRGFVQNKGFKDVSSIIDSYRHSESLIGKLTGSSKENILAFPEKQDDTAGWEKIYQKLGKPEKPDGYKIDVPKDGGDPAFADWAKKAFHSANLTSKQAEALLNQWNSRVSENAKSNSEKLVQESLAQEASLKKEWGAAFDQNVQIAKRAALSFGITADQMDKLEQALGFSGVMKFMNSIGGRLGEAEFVTNGNRNGSFGALTPEAARNRINSLKLDPDFTKRYIRGESSAREEMDRLHRMAYVD